MRAFAVRELVDGGLAELKTLFVDPDELGRGIYSLLLRKALARLRRDGTISVVTVRAEPYHPEEPYRGTRSA